MVANRNACCVCQSPRVQIHHIDGDPANNKKENLAVLCLDHHALASMIVGMSANLRPNEVVQYKEAWESRCRSDTMALARDRLSYYVTLYKNPPRIREVFLQLSEEGRHRSVEIVARLLSEEESFKEADPGFEWQTLPRKNKWTALNLGAAWHGEIWPEWLPRVGGHEEDPDFPVDGSPPYGLHVFHNFDAYCQIMVQVLAVATPPVPLEEILSSDGVEVMQSFEGTLISFELEVRGEGVTTPRGWLESRTSKLQATKRVKGSAVEIQMALRTMYGFSDTAAENLRHCRVRGVGILGSVDREEWGVCRIKVVPLLLGMGGRGQADSSGFGWKPEHYPVLPD